MLQHFNDLDVRDVFQRLDHLINNADVDVVDDATSWNTASLLGEAFMEHCTAYATSKDALNAFRVSADIDILYKLAIVAQQRSHKDDPWIKFINEQTNNIQTRKTSIRIAEEKVQRAARDAVEKHWNEFLHKAEAAVARPEQADAATLETAAAQLQLPVLTEPPTPPTTALESPTPIYVHACNLIEDAMRDGEVKLKADIPGDMSSKQIVECLRRAFGDPPGTSWQIDFSKRTATRKVMPPLYNQARRMKKQPHKIQMAASLFLALDNLYLEGLRPPADGDVVMRASTPTYEREASAPTPSDTVQLAYSPAFAATALQEIVDERLRLEADIGSNVTGGDGKRVVNATEDNTAAVKSDHPTEEKSNYWSAARRVLDSLQAAPRLEWTPLLLDL